MLSLQQINKAYLHRRNEDIFGTCDVEWTNRINLGDLWCKDGTGLPFFIAMMLFTRFRFLVVSIRFDDKRTTR